MTSFAQQIDIENLEALGHDTILPKRYAVDFLRKESSKEFLSEENYTILSKIAASLDDLYQSISGAYPLDEALTQTFSEDIAEGALETIPNAAPLAMREVKRIESQKELAELPAPDRYVDCAITLQEWDAIVEGINNAEIVCEISRGKSGNDRERLRATIPLGEIDERDWKKAKVGARFRWWIGYERVRGGTTKRVSKFVFRDMPRWSNQDLLRAEQWAEEMETKLGKHLPKLD